MLGKRVMNVKCVLEVVTENRPKSDLIWDRCFCDVIHNLRGGGGGNIADKNVEAIYFPRNFNGIKNLRGQSPMYPNDSCQEFGKFSNL